mgnify:CR=1 FL=1
MAVEYSKWRRNNNGHFVKLDIGHTEKFVVDVRDELAAGDFLNTCVATTDSTGITIDSFAPRLEQDEGFTTPHQQFVQITPTAVGVHTIKLVSTTENNITIVKHFDVWSSDL